MGLCGYYNYTTNLEEIAKGETNMSTAALSDFINVESVTAIGLEQFHSDLKEEIEQGYIEDAPDVYRLIIAIETILKELMRPEDYFAWKVSNGLDIH